MNTNTNTKPDLKQLIKDTKGKFFSITFTKNDGSVRTINGKNRYNLRVRGTGSPATKALRERGFVSFINRNSEDWVCAKSDAVVTFKCGSQEHTFTV